MNDLINMNLNFDDNQIFDEIGPEKIEIVRDPITGIKGFLVIDNSIYGLPMGGIRMAPDITLEDTTRLAREMTLKFCTYKIPLGGAKAGIIANPNESNKNVNLVSFSELIKSTIKGDGYLPEPDLGIYDVDTEKIFKVSGKPKMIPRRIGLIKFDLPLDKNLIGLSVISCLEIIIEKFEKLNKYKTNTNFNNPPRILLEGFGRVGTSIAENLKNKRFKLMGISTLKGGIFDENGLDIEKLLDLQKKFGDELVGHYKGENIIHVEKNKLFQLSSEYPVDIIIPGAKTNIINQHNIDKIDVMAIVPASSVPYAKNIVKHLDEKKILAFPDFVSNAGDVLGLIADQIQKTGRKVKEYIKEKISNKTIDILGTSTDLNISPYKYAENKAYDELRKKMKIKKKELNNLIEMIDDINL